MSLPFNVELQININMNTLITDACHQDDLLKLIYLKSKF